MLIPSRDSGFNHPHSSEITPRSVYEDRRQMLKLMAGGAAGAAMAAWAGREALAQQVAVTRPGKLAPLAGAKSAVAGAVSMEKLTDYKDEHLQQLLRIWHRQGRPRPQCAHPQDQPVDGGS